ncbi:hypothetical protein REPUB_Repub02eG0263700 [Reevesia pubescens]
MVKRRLLLPCPLRFSRRPLYGFLPHLQRVSRRRVEKQRRRRKVVQPCSRSKAELETSDKGIISKGEERDKTLELIMIQEKTESTRNEIISEAAAFELPGIPLAPSNQGKKPGVTFILEKASLVCAHVGKKYEILRSNKHAAFLWKKNKNPYNYRPDIVYEALGEIMDSRLCKAGMLEAIYVKTDEGVLIKIEPNTRMPRGLGGFCSMMVELLQRFRIKAMGNKGKLVRLVENPITQYIPVNSRKIGLSHSSNKLVDMDDYVDCISKEESLVFVVGAMTYEKIDADYIDDLVSANCHPLNAEMSLRNICLALERKWNIL